VCLCALSCVELVGVPTSDAAPDGTVARDAARPGCLGPPRGEPGAIDGARSHWGRAAPWPAGLFPRGGAIDPQGRALAFGFVLSADALDDAFVMRLLSNGELDTAWADRGIARVDGGEEGRPRRDVFLHGAVDAKGRVVAGGWTLSADAASTYRGIVARFTADGLPDRSFGRGGVATVAPRDSGFASYGSWIDGDEVLLVGAEGGNRLGAQGYVMRVTGRGEADAAFGVAGAVAVAGTRVARAALGDGDGYLVAIVATEPMGAALVRLRRDGSLDARFGVGGVLVHPRGQGVIPVSLLRQPDGALVVYGAYSPFAHQHEGAPTLVRFTPDGRPDLRYGEGGAVASREGLAVWLGASTATAAVQCDGAVLALTLFGREAPLLQRFTPEGALDTRFGSVGRVFLPTLASGGVAYAVLPRSAEASAVVLSAAPMPLVLGHHVVGL